MSPPGPGRSQGAPGRGRPHSTPAAFGKAWNLPGTRSLEPVADPTKDWSRRRRGAVEGRRVRWSWSGLLAVVVVTAAVVVLAFVGWVVLAAAEPKVLVTAATATTVAETDPERASNSVVLPPQV